MKIPRWLLCAAFLYFPAGLLADDAAKTTPREALRKVIEPFVDLFAQTDGSKHAFAMRFRLADSNTQPAELRGSTFLLRAVTAPSDKILFQYPALTTTVTICRQGQTVWAYPAAKLAPILAKVAALPLKRADRAPLEPLKLSVPETLFWIAFYFEPVGDGGTATAEGTRCRLLNLGPPDGGKYAADKYLRLFVRADNGQLVQFERRNLSDHSTYVIEQNEILPALPDTDFQPTAEQRADLLPVPIERFRPFMKAIGDAEDARRKELREHREHGAPE